MAQTRTARLGLLVNLAGDRKAPRVGWIQRLRLWQVRARSRAALRQLEPHLLRDIGVSPGQARVEAGKPFWQA